MSEGGKGRVGDRERRRKEWNEGGKEAGKEAGKEVGKRKVWR